MGSPAGYWSFICETPNYDPALGVTGDQECFLLAELEGMDWGCVSSQDEGWRCGWKVSSRHFSDSVGVYEGDSILAIVLDV